MLYYGILLWYYGMSSTLNEVLFVYLLTPKRKAFTVSFNSYQIVIVLSSNFYTRGKYKMSAIHFETDFSTKHSLHN